MRILSLPILVALTSYSCPATSDSVAEGKAVDAKADAKTPADAKPPTDAKTPDTKTADTKTADTKTPDAKTPDPAIADKRAKAKAKITGADDAELGKRRVEMLAALNEGRKLVKDGDVAGGIAKYEALLAIAPNYGPALGELGWAEFKADKLDDAHAHTLRALAEANEPNKRGMLLYNLGRIAEARGQSQAAIDHYQASLVARPNDVVAKQLADLQASVAASPTPADPTPPAGPPTIGAAAAPGLALLGKDLANLDALCELSRRDSLCGEEATCELVAAPEGAGGHGVLYTEDPGMIRCWQPVVSTPTGLMLFELSMIGQYGSEIDQDVDTISSRIETNEAGKFLIIEFSDHIYERVWEDLEGEEIPDGTATDREAMIICRIDAEPACTTAIATRHDYTGDASSYSARVTLRGAMIVVGEVVASGAITPALGGGSWDEGYQMLPAGEYAFADLARR